MMISKSGSRKFQKLAEIFVPKIGYSTITISTMIRNSAVSINNAIKPITPRGELKKSFRLCLIMRVRNKLIERQIWFT
jgi:hypothetical protein